AVGPSQGELVDEPGGAAVEDAVALATRLLPERARQVGLAHAGGSGDDHVEMVVDPAAGGQFSDERLVEAAAGRGVEILDARMAVTQLGLGEPARQTPILTLRVFSVDKQSKSLVEVHARHVR